MSVLDIPKSIANRPKSLSKDDLGSLEVSRWALRIDLWSLEASRQPPRDDLSSLECPRRAPRASTAVHNPSKKKGHRNARRPWEGRGEGNPPHYTQEHPSPSGCEFLDCLRPCRSMPLRLAQRGASSKSASHSNPISKQQQPSTQVASQPPASRQRHPTSHPS